MTALPSDSGYKFGVPRSTLRFGDAQEGLVGLGEGSEAMATVHARRGRGLAPAGGAESRAGLGAWTQSIAASAESRVPCGADARRCTRRPPAGGLPGPLVAALLRGSTTRCPGLAATCACSRPCDEPSLSRGQNGHRTAHTPLAACPAAKAPSGVGGGQTPRQVSPSPHTPATASQIGDTGARTSGDLPQPLRALAPLRASTARERNERPRVRAEQRGTLA